MEMLSDVGSTPTAFTIKHKKDRRVFFLCLILEGSRTLRGR
ncbi:MAG: hypothetical protein XD91_1502, partial [Clostridiales bacterium 38_11]